MIDASNRGCGTPVTASPMPPMAACTRAVTTIPSATPRTAPAESTTTRSPAPPASRRAKASTPAATDSPRAHRSVESAIVSSSGTSRAPRLPASTISLSFAKSSSARPGVSEPRPQIRNAEPGRRRGDGATGILRRSGLHAQDGSAIDEGSGRRNWDPDPAPGPGRRVRSGTPSKPRCPFSTCRRARTGTSSRPNATASSFICGSSAPRHQTPVRSPHASRTPMCS